MVHISEPIFANVAQALRGVTGIDAVVIGGSRATGSDTPQSDIDIGIYYGATQSIDIQELNAIVQQLDDHRRSGLVTAPGGWGPWVNAGAWMQIDGQPVDLILRDTQRVAQVIQDCESGHVSAHYQPGHPHAYINVMYMGELAVSRLLWACDVVQVLKQRAERYPDAAQHAIYAQFGFEARFSAELAYKSLGRQDAYYLIAHMIRSVSALNQMIFALNRTYCINEKNAVARVATLAHHPSNYPARVQSMLRHAGSNPTRACTELLALVDETTHLVV